MIPFYVFTKHEFFKLSSNDVPKRPQRFSANLSLVGFFFLKLYMCKILYTRKRFLMTDVQHNFVESANSDLL